MPTKGHSGRKGKKKQGLGVPGWEFQLRVSGGASGKALSPCCMCASACFSSNGSRQTAAQYGFNFVARSSAVSDIVV